MIVATCVIKLQLDGVRSLKEKRSIIKSIMARLRRNFNVATAEIDQQDVWQTAVIGLTTIGNDTAYLHGLLQTAVNWIEESRPDIPLIEYAIEVW